MKTEQISIRLTADQLQAIDAITSETVGDRSDHIRKALDEYIARNRQTFIGSGDASTFAPEAD